MPKVIRGEWVDTHHTRKIKARGNPLLKLGSGTLPQLTSSAPIQPKSIKTIKAGTNIRHTIARAHSAMCTSKHTEHTLKKKKKRFSVYEVCHSHNLVYMIKQKICSGCQGARWQGKSIIHSIVQKTQTWILIIKKSLLGWDCINNSSWSWLSWESWVSNFVSLLCHLRQCVHGCFKLLNYLSNSGCGPPHIYTLV